MIARRIALAAVVVCALIADAGSAFAQRCRARTEPGCADDVHFLRADLRITLARTSVDGIWGSTEFNRAAALWGYSGFAEVPAVAAEFSWSVLRWLHVGGRASYAWSTAGFALFDAAQLTTSIPALGASAGLRAIAGGHHVAVIFDATVYADLAVPSVTLRSETSTTAAPRFGARASLDLAIHWVVFGAFAGYESLVYDSGGTTPISLTGPVLGASLGIRR